MTVMTPSRIDDTKSPEHLDVSPGQTNASYDDESSSLDKSDVLGAEHVDLVLDAKMHLVNDAISEIGFTGYHWKLFVLNGFGSVSYICQSRESLAQFLVYRHHHCRTK
jgi:hypothetical protein